MDGPTSAWSHLWMFPSLDGYPSLNAEVPYLMGWPRVATDLLSMLIRPMPIPTLDRCSSVIREGCNLRFELIVSVVSMGFHENYVDLVDAML